MAASFFGMDPRGEEGGTTSARGGRVASSAAWVALAASAAAAWAAASASAAAPGRRGKAGPEPAPAPPRRPPKPPPPPPADLRSASGVRERAAASGSSTSIAVRSGAFLSPRMDAYKPSTRVDSEGAKRRVRSSRMGATNASLRCSAALIPSLLRCRM